MASPHEIAEIMIRIILTILLIPMPLLAFPSTISHIDPPKTVEELVSYYADQFGVDQELAHYIAENESHYNPDAVGDMDITCPSRQSPYYGEPVRARGVFQITQCWYPNVKDSEAFDADSNIKLAMGIISKGKEHCRSQFSTCDRYYAKI